MTNAKRKIDTNGYVYLMMPSHHKAKPSGAVYEHYLEVEIKIGRKLRDGEVVHHEDKDRTNNSHSNLFVFKSQADHIRYHRGGMMVEVEENLFITPKRQATCKHCNRKYDYILQRDTYCSVECSRLGSRKVVRPSKEELLVLIQSKPIVGIGKIFGVSDKAVRKWCVSYGLPSKRKDIKNM